MCVTPVCAVRGCCAVESVYNLVDSEVAQLTTGGLPAPAPGLAPATGLGGGDPQGDGFPGGGDPDQEAAGALLRAIWPPQHTYSCLDHA